MDEVFQQICDDAWEALHGPSSLWVKRILIERRWNGNLRFEGVLLGYDLQDEIMCAIVGEYVCASCGLDQVCSDVWTAYFAPSSQGVYCISCVILGQGIPADARAIKASFPYAPLPDDFPWIVSDAQRPREEHEAIWSSTTTAMASVAGVPYVYLWNLRLSDVRAVLLARRVWRRWRRCVLRRWRGRVAHALVHAAGLDHHMAHVWTREHISDSPPCTPCHDCLSLWRQHHTH